MASAAQTGSMALSAQASQPLFPCAGCAAVFGDEAAYTAHASKADCTGNRRCALHQNIKPSHAHVAATTSHQQPQGAYACPSCSFTFSSYNQLQYHAAISHPQPSFADLPVYQMATQVQHPQPQVPARTSMPPYIPTRPPQMQHQRRNMTPNMPPQAPVVPQVRPAAQPGVTQLLYNGNMWTILPETAENIEALGRLRASREELVQNGHKLQRQTEMEVNSKRKCKVCRVCYTQTGAYPECKYHSGRVIYHQLEPGKSVTMYDCCGKAAGQVGCTLRESHVFPSYEDTDLTARFVHAPLHNPHAPGRRAIAIDCEMGQAENGQLELIQLVAIDYFTAEVLINKIVKANRHIYNFNTRYSGITAQRYHHCIDHGNFLDGRAGAREELFKWVDTNTILIGHSIKNDLDQVQLFHENIVDSSLCIPKLKAEGHSLKSLCEKVLGKKVQARGHMGHDCLEDTLGTRELAIWASMNPEIISIRRKQQRCEQELEALERKKRTAQREASKLASASPVLSEGSLTPTPVTPITPAATPVLSNPTLPNTVKVALPPIQNPPALIPASVNPSAGKKSASNIGNAGANSNSNGSNTYRRRAQRGSPGNGRRPQKDGKFVLGDAPVSAKNGRAEPVPRFNVVAPTPVKPKNSISFGEMGLERGPAPWA